MSLIIPEWNVPATVRALATTRLGGISGPPWDALNLGAHVGDSPTDVQINRQRLVERAELPAMPVWLEQVHGIKVLHLTDKQPHSLQADAAYTRERGVVCAVMTADCLPVLFCSRDGKEIAAAHAGWRGLCAGVLEATLDAFRAKAEDIFVWMGPAIGPDAFEVGPEVRKAFIAQDLTADAAFRAVGEKYYADIWQLARTRLVRRGVREITGGGLCTLSDQRQFFSFRRDGVTGRMASLIWLI
ncbi:peptidoglycan editing factor PgeF [Erwinia psidii]|uniref:purine nucleoside phosphorylase YfiH n=1 Tax=Erwinia psidii TaxID=69224 RepID=UPI00226B7582|nr:purine nucleoside phosphorylase YfiH [Erwinia psidii]MCX8958163.1 peptidoglycan editing factor PgeF [Erwinia psidii]MCX8962550.1 peptidoglycan editing factor PgeF [Erwinia psidii]MCX8967342.1 peptidoglycan editing factor PgeF [Erwinia psidii]